MDALAAVDEVLDEIEKTADRAMMGEVPSGQTPGGIDFNANNLNLKEQGSGVEIQFNFESLQGLQPDQVNGILPVIINITPVTNFPLLLGLSLENITQDELSLAK